MLYYNRIFFVTSQPDSTRDQDLRELIGSGRRRREVELQLRGRDGQRSDREKRPISEEEYGMEEGEVEVEEEEEEEEASAPSTTVSSVVRLVDR